MIVGPGQLKDVYCFKLLESKNQHNSWYVYINDFFLIYYKEWQQKYTEYLLNNEAYKYKC